MSTFAKSTFTRWHCVCHLHCKNSGLRVTQITEICVKINDICCELIPTKVNHKHAGITLTQKQHTHAQQCLHAYSHQTSTSTFPRITMQLRRESLFGRLRPTHPYYDKINLFFSCWGGGCRGRGKQAGKMDGMRQDIQVWRGKKKAHFEERLSATGQRKCIWDKKERFKR